MLRRPYLALVGLAEAIVALAGYVVRDLAVIASAHARDPAPPGQPREPIRAALWRGRAAAVLTRHARLAAQEVATRPTRHLVVPRALALFGIAVAGLLGVGLAVAVAHSTGAELHPGADWLAGLFDQLGAWWNGLPWWEQLIVFAAMVVFLVFGGLEVMPALFAAGALTLVLDKAKGIATFTRDPARATRGYFATTTPVGVGVDAAEWALTFIPTTGVAGRTLREALAEFLRDPAAWRAARRASLRDPELRELGGKRWTQFKTFNDVQQDVVRTVPRQPRAIPDYHPGTAIWDKIHDADIHQAATLRDMGFHPGTRPYAHNRKLQNIIDDYFKHHGRNDAVGDGGTPDAIRYELATGRSPARSGKMHIRKGRILLNRLDDWLKEPSIYVGNNSPRDINLAEFMRTELDRALKGY